MGISPVLPQLSPSGFHLQRVARLSNAVTQMLSLGAEPGLGLALLSIPTMQIC